MSEEIKETPTGELEQGEFKIKKKPGRPKKLTQKDKPIKLDLSKKEEENAVPESKTEEAVLPPTEGSGETRGESKVELQEVGETHTEEKETPLANKEETPVVEEITNEVETKTEEEVIEDIKEEIAKNPNIDLPENVEKLVSFMKETGGNIEDYVRLNADYSNLNEDALLNEYYKKTRPHLEPDEVKFLMEDKFSYDEEMDEERDVRRKKLAYKEEIAKAKGFLEETKKKYYDEIKLRPGVTQDQQKATDFFNRYNKEQGEIQQKHEQFKRNTKDYFTKEFKGFEFEVGEKRFRYNVNNVNEVVENQSALSNFVKKFLNKDGNVKDLTGYHKALYSAQHADAIAKHFYDQGAADATKNVIAKSKNISNEARTTHSGDVFINGLKVKAINGVDSSKLKIKKRK
tara:strand:- start:525 stop:1730 length:1206 start_codon:yes stop_codon:yes gene_type:complete